MRKQIARWLIVAMVTGSTPAWAQGQGDRRTPQEESSSSVPLTIPPCVPDGWTPEAWLNASPEEQQRVCASIAQQVNWTQKGSRAQAIGRGVTGAGLGVLVVGLIMVIPHGEEYHILGDTYCVSNDYHDVNYGGCGPSDDTLKWGAILLGAGAVTMLVGVAIRSMIISPVVGSKVKGVSATVRW